MSWVGPVTRGSRGSRKGEVPLMISLRAGPAGDLVGNLVGSPVMPPLPRAAGEGVTPVMTDPWGREGLLHPQIFPDRGEEAGECLPPQLSPLMGAAGEGSFPCLMSPEVAEGVLMVLPSG